MRCTAAWLACCATALAPQRHATRYDTPRRAARTRIHAVPRLNNPNLGQGVETPITTTPSARTGLPIGTGRGDLGSMAFEGDYVVHYERGVARYAGRVVGEHDSTSAEPPILLRFADKTVALEHAEAQRLTRLRGSDEIVENLSGPAKSETAPPTLSKARIAPSQKPPTLSKWARPDVWHRKRDRAEAASRDHARELLTMAAARSSRERRPLDSLKDEDEAKLDEGLGFEMTPGQRKCWLDVEEDLCRRLAPMDRLVFGDVGFGKTEIALRSALLAARGGRQVAVLAPTTVLARQHLNVFRRRLAPLNVSVELLVAPRPGETVDEGQLNPRHEARRVRAAVASGACEVCVGTHALLSPRLPWRNLGLAVVDEEQRFGVRQKERFKAACVDVDVLTLSATPIPRTLGAALAGLRDTSELPEAPPGRGTTASIVRRDQRGLVEDEAFLTALLRKELGRGGQCFYVVPRIADVEDATLRIEAALETLRHPALGVNGSRAVSVAHGRIPDAGRVVQRFSEGSNATRPVLLATSLVENGLDLPKCNTIIIQDAQKFGLASLHQLRGRVGRGSVPAVAVFLHPADSDRTLAAGARLRAVADPDASTGPELARRDLEIRGAGALLGTKQSGRASRAVGDEMYASLLVAELGRLRALDVKAAKKGCECFLPLARRLTEAIASDAYQTPLEATRTAPTPAETKTKVRLAIDRGADAGLAKACAKVRLLELHSARLGIVDVALETKELHDLTTPHGLLSAPDLDPKTWKLLRSEVPEHARESFRFDEFAGRVECVRLGALPPAKQVDFLLEAVLHMVGFLDRVNQVAPALNEMAVVNATAANATAAVFA